jgi:hypothetical protein
VLLCVQSRSSRRSLRLKLHWMMLMFWYCVENICFISFAGFPRFMHVTSFFSLGQIRKMDLEARSLQPSAKAMMLAKLREYKSDLNKLKREFKRISSPNADQASREELLESGMANVHPVCLDHTVHSLLRSKFSQTISYFKKIVFSLLESHDFNWSSSKMMIS